jgi:uncharacterized repeat protein (TIGR01451 family)
LLYGKNVDLNGSPGNGKLEQTVTGLTSGQVYVFQLNFANEGNANRYANIRLLDSISGTLMSRRIACDHDETYQGWCTLRHSFAAPADGIVKVVLENDETDGSTVYGVVIDNVLITRDLNFVVNGNFSSAPTGLNQPFIPGWSITDSPDVHDGHSGSQYRFQLDLAGSPGSVTARQNISGLAAGQSYTLRYFYASGADSINSQFNVQVLPISGTALINLTQSTGLNAAINNSGWREGRHTFTAPADGVVSILFRDINSDGNGDYGAFIDNVSVFGTTTVPNITQEICSSSAPLAIATGPGGVTNGLRFWVRADKGVYNNTNGTAATAGDLVKRWDDLSGYGLDVVPTSGRDATYRAGTAQTNYNPYLDFLNDYMVNYSQIMPVFSDMTMLGVGYKTASGGIDTLFSTGDNGNDPTLDVTNLDFNPWADASSPAFVTHVGSPVVQNRMYLFDMRAQNGVSNDLVAGLSGRDHANNMEVLGDSDLNMFRKANIGSDGGGENWDGAIVESILFSRDLTGTELSRVRSYLAIRNGVTLDISPTNAAANQNYDYLDSGSATVWAGNSSNAAYHFDVAGIGRDDASLLDQRKSISVNGDDPVTMDNGGSFSADRSFLMWGNNDLAASYAVSYTPDSFVPTVPYYRMSRIWKVQETGTVGSVQVIPSVGAEYLIVDTDGDGNFNTGTQDEVALSGGSFAYNFDSNDYFTFISPAVAPGGVVSNLTFWYKPEAGVTLNGGKVSSWVDASNGIEAVPASASSGPTYYNSGSNMMNFNPTLNFSGATHQDGLRVDTGLPDIPNGVSTFSVLLPEDASNRWFLQWGVSGAGYYNNYGHCNANNPGVWTNSHGGCVNNPTTLGPITTTSFVSVRWNTTASTNQWQLRRNGQAHNGTTTSTPLNVPANTALEIGDVNNRSAGNDYVGKIAEVIGYTSRLSDTDRQKVESYLSIKYGITYLTDDGTGASDYFDSAGSKVWDATANSTYGANIAGIGRDDASTLNQKQSRSGNADQGIMVTIGLGTIATSNAANTAAFSADKSFLLWGNNSGAATLSANYAGGTNNRIARVWKVQETGTVGTVKLVIPRSVVSGAGLRTLIVNTSNTFASVDRTYPLVSRGGNYEVLVDFNNNDFFTFSTSSTLPEIDVTPTVLDFGTVATGITSTAQAVTIQNLGDVSLSLGSIALSGGDAIQFAISNNTCGASITPGGSCTVSVVFRPASSGAKNAQLVINSGDSDEPTVNVTLVGSAPNPAAVLNKYNLTVLKSSSVMTATTGTPFSYTITVRNKGTVAASNVVATDTLPAGVTFNSATPTGGGTCTHISGVVTCNWPSLAAGASATVMISVTP